MKSLSRFRWPGLVATCLYALAACTTEGDPSTGQPGDTQGGSPPTGGTGATGGSGGSDLGGMGGEGDDPGGAGAGGSGGAGGAGGIGGVPDGSGTGGEGGDPVDPVTVVSARLPEATLNQDYSFVFEASGGSADYAFTLGSGALPRGLTLEEDGTLSGRPLEGGDFELEFVVTDSGGRTARVTLRLHVRQSRWLTYWNALFGNESIPRFSAIDLADPNLVRRDLSGTLPVNQNGTDASVSGFSPDGRFAIHSLFVYGEHVGNEFRLVDFDRLATFDWEDPMNPEEPRIVANNFDQEYVKMYGPQWSPDSQRLAAMSLIEDASGDLRYPGRFTWFEIDEVLDRPNRAANLHRRLENTTTNTVDWISADTVVYGSQTIDENENFVTGPLLKAKWQNGEPGAPTLLLGSTGQTFNSDNTYVQYVNHATRTAVIAAYGNPHCLPSIELIRFATPEATSGDVAVNLGEAPLLPGPALDRFAGVLESSLKIVNAATEPLATLGASDCNLIDWSLDGTRLGWVNTADNKYYLTTLDPDGVTWHTNPSGFAYVSTVERPRFSPDNRWFAFRADNNLYVTRIDGTTLGDSVRINVDLVATGDRVGSYQFSPNGRALVYAAPGQIAGLEDLYLVDLSGDTPGMSRRISPDLSGFPTGDALVIPPPDTDYDEFMARRYPVWSVWAPDSSKVFFVVHDSGGQVGDALYIVDVLAERPMPRQVDVALCDSSACGSINVVIPQPLR